MTVDIVELDEIRLLGLQIRMSLKDNKTYELWHEFMKLYVGAGLPKQTNMYSVEDYGNAISEGRFTPASEFTKWACAEHQMALADIPNMQPVVIPGGLYATFEYRGQARNIGNTMAEFYTQWLPGSRYEVDNRLHFAVMGDRYLGHDNPNSIEDFFIPVKLKTSG